MSGKSHVTEPEGMKRASSPSSVSSSRMSSLFETSFHTYEAVNQKLEILEQQMDELSISFTQSDLRRENILARALVQLQSISAAVHFESATINFQNDSEVEPMTPPTKDIDPMFLDTTTMSITDTLPLYQTNDYGLLEGNPCSSDTKDELITTSSMLEERVPTTPNSCSATNCGTRNLSGNAVLEAEKTPTPNILQNQSTTPMDSVCDSDFPGTKSSLSISWLLPDLLKESIEPGSAKHGLQDFLLANPPIFIPWLPSCSTKTRPAGHRRGRPPRTSGKHTWQAVLLYLHDGGRRGRPPRPVCLLTWSQRPKEHRRGRPPNNSPSRETDSVSTIFLSDFRMIHTCCMSCCYRIIMSIHRPNHTTSFQGVRRCRQRLNYPSAFLCRAFNFVYSSLFSCGRRCQTIKARGSIKAPVEGNNTPVKLNCNGQRPEYFTTFGNGHSAV